MGISETFNGAHVLVSIMEPSSDAMSVLECDHCRTEFEKYTYRITDGNNFCSKECRIDFQKSKSHYEPCSNCGEEVQVPPSRRKSEYGDYHIDNHFCDKECESEWKSENWVGDNHPTWASVEVECEECGDVYEAKPSEVDITRYCSMTCKREAWADDPVELECSICGNEFPIQPHRIRSENPTCSKECHSEFLSQLRKGENNPAWKGGKEEYYGPNWDFQRRKTLERDEFACRLCGMNSSEHRTEYGNQLNVHHIVRLKSFDRDYETANKLSNLVTLCHGCHNLMEPESEDKQRELLAAAY